MIIPLFTSLCKSAVKVKAADLSAAFTMNTLFYIFLFFIYPFKNISIVTGIVRYLPRIYFLSTIASAAVIMPS